MMFKWDELIKITDAQVLKNELVQDYEFDISTDTRKISEKDIYLPLKGANFDGENFVDSPGICAYFTTTDRVTKQAKFVLKVENTLSAYLKIAQYYRRKINPTAVGITGSSGKTTTKEMVYSVLSQKFRTHKTFSNHNNEIGFCQTVLSMPNDTEVLIVEAGMRALGEIELISTYLEPNYTIITNCGTAHLGRLGSLDNIAKAKCEISKGLKPDGTFITREQDIIKKHAEFNGEKIYYNLNNVKIIKQAPAYSQFEYKGEVYELNTEGEYNIENALGAIELGLKLSMTPEEIKKGLLSYRPIEKRWEVEEIHGFKFINDSYNANPDSMKASVKTFTKLYKNPVVILGDMGELGELSEELHKQTGEFFSQNCDKNVKFLTVGTLATNIAKELSKCGFETKSFDTVQDVACYILENLNNSYTIFLKASRSMKFEEILEIVRKGICKL